MCNKSVVWVTNVLHKVANFTWLHNSMGQPGAARTGPADGDRGLTRFDLLAGARMRPDKGAALIGAWPRIGPLRLGAWRTIRFELADRDPTVLRPNGCEVVLWRR
jgi:hypothetical protein